MWRKAFDFLIFSSLYIALCACLMVYQTSWLFLDGHVNWYLLPFVFFSTMCSYNFHWYLSTHAAAETIRMRWTLRHKTLHLVLYLIGAVGAAWYFFKLRPYWPELAFGAFVTFLYSAPKIPHPLFRWLRNIAVGKTIFLAFVWMYVTTALPFMISGRHWQADYTWFCGSRFFLIYAICILFDYRDREDDKTDGIRSMITWLNERGITNLFAGSLILFAISTVLLYHQISIADMAILLVPGIIVAALYNYARTHFSDYLYYFVLDGLMMFSALLMLIMRI